MHSIMYMSFYTPRRSIYSFILIQIIPLLTGGGKTYTSRIVLLV